MLSTPWLAAGDTVMPISSYLNEANQILNVMNKAKEYLDGVSFTVSISNYSTEYVCIDSFILDDSLFDVSVATSVGILHIQ
ncbi:hypothetical protein [Piscirickettsia salmonis]|uniref:hypothetical protein n=1 Tax=Piscirickettsia salmonis TaxID=1238 RepID=UPI0012B70A7C|nr:hypothetical protein [Piscirickettsia salmonis]QHS33299.1 hypothetical protein GW535_13155 [Piscirickettsia salmonis]QIX54719.1 hypothetical protein GW536_03630 [Piscirickettsia salmonis]